MKRLIPLLAALCVFVQAQTVTDAPGTLRLWWENPPAEVLQQEGVTGYLVKHAWAPSEDLLSSAVLTNFMLLPIDPLQPPNSVAFPNLPVGWHAFSMQSSNALQTPPEVSNVATGYCSWTLRGPMNLVITCARITNVSIILNP